LKPVLEAIGIRLPFEDLALLPGTVRTPVIELNQKIDVQIDRLGFRADAETIGGGIYGGIMGATDHFHMKFDRPFVFFFRDNLTNSLLFAGVVMDPSPQPSSPGQPH
jgi:serine protease inhibitor